MFSDPRSVNSQMSTPLNSSPTALSTIAPAPLTNSLTANPSFSSSSSATTLIATSTNNLSSSSSINLSGGSSITTATNLGTLTGAPISINDFVGNVFFTNDYYKFTVGATSNLNLALIWLSSNADVQVLNNAGVVIATSNYSSNHDEAINLAGVSAGTYYARVYNPGSSTNLTFGTNFTLDLSVTALSTPSNLLPIQLDVGQLTGTRIFTGSINDNHTADVFHFQIANPGHFDLTLSGLGTDVDVRLIRDFDGNRIVDNGDELLRSERSGQLAESINLSNLGAGDYYVGVYQFSGNTNYHLSLSTGDWFSNNLQDAGIIGEARYGYLTDGAIKRNDVLNIFSEVEKEGSVGSTALTDLRTLVNNSGLLDLPDSVLAGKVVNGNVANAQYQGAALGNLYAGSSSTQLKNLVDKWFWGSDRPVALSGNRTTTYAYNLVSGSLFQDGISYTDIQQGNVGDCYFMAGLAATALRSADTIRNMFIDNGDGTFTVRFFNNGTPDYVTVDRYLPTDINGYAVFAGWGGGVNTNTSNELWFALAEKAYAQLNESGWIGQDNTNSYNGLTRSLTPVQNNTAGINGGFPIHTIKQITGQNTVYSSISSTTLSSVSINNVGDIVNAFNSGKLVTLDTRAITASNIVSSHAYTVVRYDQKNDRFTLFNPWGIDGGYENSQYKPGFISVSRQDVINNFVGWDQTV